MANKQQATVVEFIYADTEEYHRIGVSLGELARGEDFGEREVPTPAQPPLPQVTGDPEIDRMLREDWLRQRSLSVKKAESLRSVRGFMYAAWLAAKRMGLPHTDEFEPWLERICTVEDSESTGAAEVSTAGEAGEPSTGVSLE